MLDLSNVNVRPGGPQPNFRRIHDATPHRRLLLKATQGPGFVDGFFVRWLGLATAAGLRVGVYHFAEPGQHTPAEEAAHFLAHVDAHAAKLRCRPVLDLEHGRPQRRYAKWAADWLTLVRRELGIAPVLYSYGSYLEGCHFERVLAPLWLANYGRNDGKEHPFTVPAPWPHLAAHQYSSRARVPGVAGAVDITHVYRPRLIDWPGR